MLKRFFWALTQLALVAIVCAQDPFHRPGPLAGRTFLTLALFDEVRTELKTTSDTNSKIDGLLEKYGADVQEAVQGAGGDFSQMRPAIDKLTTKYDAETLKLLTDDQSKRFQQLFIQYNGSSALTNTTISKDFGLTDDQKAKLKKLQDDQFQKMSENFQAGLSPEDMQKAFKKQYEDFNDAIDKLLTDDQKKKFKDMQGTKFEFKKVEGS